MKRLVSFSIIIIIVAILFGSCRTTVNPNEWVVSTATCWNTFTVTKAGQPIPRLLSACDRLVILPATEMSAEFKVETKFQNRVAGLVSVAYQWKIVDPVLFIQSAKSVTSSSVTDDYKIDPSALEALENGVVDKIVMDILREYTPQLPAGTDELQIEKDLNSLTKPTTTERGIEFSNTSINVTFSEQTEEALDVMSALQFYRQNGEEELGRDVIRNKASAPTIIFEKQQ